MKRHIGSCGLCLTTKELQNSHLLPAAIYKLSRSDSRKNPNPVVITKGRAFTTSRQVSTYFLCVECEDKFSRNGEQYVSSQCARRSGEFKLRERLEKESPIYVDSRFKVFNITKLPGMKVDQYLYFAASVFWRASAHKWKINGRARDLIALGSKYQEEFRRYLFGEAVFPANARIFIHVWSDDPIDFTTTPPCTVRIEGSRRHKFSIPGITFILFLGSDTPKKYDLVALNSTNGHFMRLCQWKDDSLFRGFLTHLRELRPLLLRFDNNATYC